jgi:hypothetical protein
MTKVLWAVSMKTQAAKARILANAKAIGATHVCIRTDNVLLAGAIKPFHAAGLKVYGWRWPAVTPGPHTAAHYYAMDEAHHVTTVLMPAGLDGYIADIESDGPAHPDNDWDNASHATLAHDFCTAIKGAAPPGFHFGVTSGCRQPTGNPHIPWSVFAAAADALYPQAYWRAALDAGPTAIHGGSPAASHAKAKAAWGPIAAGKPLHCMAGEVHLATAAEIAAYGATLAAGEARHFYCDDPAVTPALLAAMKAT